jgi:hypothetical protein
VQCDKCQFWQHAACVLGKEAPTEEDVEKLGDYICAYCKAEKEKLKKKKPKSKKIEEKDFNPNSSDDDDEPEYSESE